MGCERSAPDTECGRRARINCDSWTGDSNNPNGYVTSCRKQPKCKEGYKRIDYCNPNCPGRPKGMRCGLAWEKRAICMRDWDDVMSKPNRKKICCTDSEPYPGNCAPEFCHKSQTCLASMKQECTPGNWDRYCDIYVQTDPSENRNFSRSLIKNVVGDFYGQSNQVSGTKSAKIVSERGTPSSDHPFVAKSIELCNLAPGACDDILRNACKGYTREQLKDNVQLRKVCGCFLPDSEYPYRSMIDTACDPMCIYNEAIRQGTKDGEPIQCQQTSCIMDGVTANLGGGAQVEGGVTIEQACGGKSSPANCYISNNVLNFVSGKADDGVNLVQHCGKCFTYDPSNPTKQTPIRCGTGEILGDDITPDERTNRGGDINRQTDNNDNTIDNILNDNSPEGSNKRRNIIIGISVAVVLLFIMMIVVMLV